MFSVPKRNIGNDFARILGFSDSDRWAFGQIKMTVIPTLLAQDI